jgi:hypothetical protein
MYFNVDKFPEYGQLSGRKLEDNRAGERVAVDSRKKNPADFALWKICKGVRFVESSGWRVGGACAVDFGSLVWCWSWKVQGVGLWRLRYSRYWLKGVIQV